MKVILPTGQTLTTDDKTAQQMIACGLAKSKEEKPKAEQKGKPKAEQKGKPRVEPKGKKRRFWHPFVI